MMPGVGIRHDECYHNGMREKAAVVQLIREGFCDTEHPGDPFLVGSREGCEPGEVTAPFLGISHWSEVSSATLDENSEALSFFSEGGFRYFLPAFLLAHLEDKLDVADPVFHLTNGFEDTVIRLPMANRTFEKRIGKSAFVNPRRFGAMRFLDYSRYRLSIFSREESEAIVAFLEYCRDRDADGFDAPKISAALDDFWYERARSAPPSAELRRHVEEEAAYLQELQNSPPPSF